MAEVIVFPQAKRIGRIQRVAENISNTTEHGARTYWNRIVADMRRAMVAAGLEAEVIEREIDDFGRAVGAALTRQGGAA
jgi:hypothetical protein